MPQRAQTPSFSGPEFRAALGMFATGVTIVTARTADGRLVGLTASSFNSVSIDPPLVLWSLARAASSMPVFATGSHYAINVLAADQKELAERFARRSGNGNAGADGVVSGTGAGNREDAAVRTGSSPRAAAMGASRVTVSSLDTGRWSDVAFSQGVGGAPLIAGAAAHFECFNRSRYDEGDHTIFVGEVEACDHREGASPLLFHGGRFYTEHRL